uniref:Antimicrobial peptide n=1 Tax=Hadrurus spadix TaxID=141984 RepID=A0A1W7RAZ3_9SCOR
MQLKFIIFFLLGMATFCTCGILKEKHFHKAVDYLVPAVVPDVVKNLAKQAIHKIAKSESFCMFGKDMRKLCNQSCMETLNMKGNCHGTKCKCEP